MRNFIKMKSFFHLYFLLTFVSCQSQKSNDMPHTNALINETSPYLLQHAHNPVDWNAWHPETLQKAVNENKLILVSIGYAACHWCHVMEHESFEDSTVAAVMNSQFINIKVDREERPDVDQIYMNAVQLMTGSGGWPLNVVALPDGRPVWGGTFFRKDDWINILNQIADMYQTQPEKLEEYASRLAEGVKQMDLVSVNTETQNFNLDSIDIGVKSWQAKFDREYGGKMGAPKFMMPTNFQFLLRYAYQTQNLEVLDYVHLSLQKMAFGGVYDQVGGGFSRYSVDAFWHVPHFEKMLYDNAQMVSLYAQAYRQKPERLYKDIVYETLAFVNREMKNEAGGFYSSYDADSEGEEGKYYVWTKDELKKLLKKDFDWFAKVYNINDFGFWENGNYVLIRKENDESLTKYFKISIDELHQKMNHWKKTLREEREKRVKPGLDDKTLTAWNALMISGYVDAYKTFGDKEFLDTSIRTAEFIVKHQLQPDGGLWRNYKNGKSNINAYLDDYAAAIDAFISLYEITLDEAWLHQAKKWTDYVYAHFYNPENHFFYYTSDLDKQLVSRSTETSDNVIPSSNSMMAKNLFKLGYHFDQKKYLETSAAMLHNILPTIGESGAPWYSNWLDLMLNYTLPYYEVAISGSKAKQKMKDINKKYLPNVVLAGSQKESNLPLLENRFMGDETYVYVCQNYVCQLPTTSVGKAVELIKLY